MLRIHSLKQTCIAAPSQWEARSVDGRPVYIRYRQGELTVRVGPIGGTIADAIGSAPVIDMDAGERLGSFLDWEEVVDATGIEVIDT